MPIATMLLVMWMGGGCYEMPAGKSMTVTPEHVIEIRTKRLFQTTACKGSKCYAVTPPLVYCPQGYTCHDDNVKTLWIDGVRTGTIREVEEK